MLAFVPRIELLDWSVACFQVLYKAPAHLDKSSGAPTEDRAVTDAEGEHIRCVRVDPPY